MFILERCGEGELELPSGGCLCLRPGRWLQGGCCGMAELMQGGAAQPGAAVTCGVRPEVPAPSLVGQGVRVSPGDLGFQVLDTVSLAAPAEQSWVR